MSTKGQTQGQLFNKISGKMETIIGIRQEERPCLVGTSNTWTAIFVKVANGQEYPLSYFMKS